EGVRIAFFQPQAAILRAQRIAVDRAFGQAGNEDFPDAAQAMTAHAVNAGIPVVERADDADLIGVGSPYGKADAAHAVNLAQVRAEFLITVEQVALAEKM